jgi:hypothetical protein
MAVNTDIVCFKISDSISAIISPAASFNNKARSRIMTVPERKVVDTVSSVACGCYVSKRHLR